ncbi:ATP-dependent DNA helicase UvrD1 [subsurface metagenome]
MPWYEGLDEPMRLVAGMDHSPFRVWAGPGTGKTLALMRRVARLLEEGHDGCRILIVTFTRTAAHDLVRKLQELQAPGCGNVHASTLHSFCFSMLARDQVLQLTGRVPRPLLRPSAKIKFEVDFLLHDLPARFEGMRARDKRLRAFESDWARLQSDEPGWTQDPVDSDFKDELLSWLQFHKAMLIGELVPESLHYLRDNPACEERNAFDHVLVDEYQDLNKAEQVLVDLLAEDRNLLVAGDDDQSIYSFKFAHPEGIIEFPEKHPGTYTEPLAESLRCPAKVIEMANCLISHNRRPDPARCIKPALGAQTGEVDIVQWTSLEEEAQGLAHVIRLSVPPNGDVPRGSVLVLAPRRVIGYAIRDALQKLQVEAHSFFPEEALDSERARQRFTLLTLLANPTDRVALRCWLGFGDLQFRKEAYTRLREHCEDTGSEPWDVLANFESGRLSISGAEELVGRFRELKAELARLQGMELSALIDELFPDGEEEIEAIRILALEAMTTCGNASELREELRIRITQPELPSEGEFVRVMSLHKGKGLTADLVVVSGCVEGFIPTWDEQVSLAKQQRQFEEQRRLFYMAITRTTHYVILSSFRRIDAATAHKMGAKFRQHFGRDKVQTIASRFISELGESAPQSIRGEELMRRLSGKG